MKKILLLGSGELGKEFVIAAKRKGCYVVACDRYDNAPAMQVADEREVFSMLDGEALEAVVRKHRPDIIVPEIEAIRTEKLFQFEQEGIQVVPSARAVNYTMNRRAIRDLASQELGLRTAKYFYAKSFDEFAKAAEQIGYPCVVKPLMSSSGHGQSYVHNDEELKDAFREAMEEGRGDVKEVIIEEFIDFDSEFTLLTVTQKNGPTLFCPPIGHVQKGGDYRESWQPYKISSESLAQAQHMADQVTKALTGAGIWGVEFFLNKQGEVIFSELSPRPHDTGMVTLGHTTNLSEFELHLRAVLGLPIPAIHLEHAGASAVILSPTECSAVSPKECSAVSPAECSAVSPKECSAVSPAECSAVSPKECSAVLPAECSAVLPVEYSAVSPAECSAVSPKECSAVLSAECSAVLSAECSAVSPKECSAVLPLRYNLETALREDRTRVRIFGKPDAHKGRRMGVVLCYGDIDADVTTLRDKAKKLAQTVLGTDPYMKK